MRWERWSALRDPTYTQIPSVPLLVKQDTRSYPRSVKVSLNGEHKEVADGACVADLIEQLTLGTKRLAVELNGEVLRKESWPERVLSDGDSIEIVHFVGGG